MKKDIFREKIEKDSGLTLFQKKVLKTTLKIPKGEVRSYAWVARKAGYSGASRAVGQALKRNTYAPHVPCHRVIRTDGRIGGYSGGLARKRGLLAREGIRDEIS